MNYEIEKVNSNNYHLFDDMIFWRANGYERTPEDNLVSDNIVKELENPNLYIYAMKMDNRYIGWISLVYIPKVGRWNGNGHIYVDELWIEPSYRGRGLSKILMREADMLKVQLNATGIRLYVNVDNPTAQCLYERCGFIKDGQAYFMEKE